MANHDCAACTLYPGCPSARAASYREQKQISLDQALRDRILRVLGELAPILIWIDRSWLEKQVKKAP